MGVPKFFRWISARYPCINQVVEHDEVPEIDHLYLDMNGILHNCSHPEGASELMSEEVIFENVRNYIEFLFNLTKPCKTFFMAVDGVAPRAKMTQQRARRFQSAKEAKDEAASAVRKGQAVKERFDSCVISPGTEFMERMHNALKKYIEERVLHSDEWRNVDVFLSGHDCPGEGEHKIREFMLYRREQPNYIPNERHCIYGMDADLIFLGLTTHEVNMCIIRENVIKARTCLAEATPFCITYVTLVREYIDCEFKSLKDSLPFPYNLEHIIDDWIFMAFLLGNDFIPHLPNLHIHAESLLVLWDTYHVVMPKLDGYLVEFGQLNVARFDRYLEELSKFEQQWFEDREADHRWMRGKRGHQMARQLENLGQDLDKADGGPVDAVKSNNNRPGPRSSSSPVVGGADLDDVAAITGFFASEQDELLEADCPDEYEDLLQEGVIIFPFNSTPGVSTVDRSAEDVHSGSADEESDYNNDGDDDSGQSTDEDQLIYQMHRRDYYFTKLSIQIDQHSCSPETATAPVAQDNVLFPLVRDYVRMLQWILSYYFLKVADWQFFYSYHYAPFACDLRIFTRTHLANLDPAKSPRSGHDWTGFSADTQPVKPFVQQLMIMPPDAAYILPEAYRDVMTSPNSPIAPYFPREFSTDLNGKISTWEAVALIPFIDEAVLLKTMAPLHKLLTKTELQRNQHKHHLLFPASVGGPNQHIQKIQHDFFRKSLSNPGELLPPFYSAVKHSVASDFPSLLRLQFMTKVMKIPVHVFEHPSLLDSLVLRLPGHHQDRVGLGNNLGELARRLLGKAARVRWPYLATVMPVRLMTAGHIWELKDYNISPSQLQKLASLTSALQHRPVDTSDARSAINLKWFTKQTDNLYRHYRVRRAIIVDSDKDDDGDGDDLVQTETPESLPVLLFSRKLVGWYVNRRRDKKRNVFVFTLAPLFAKSRVANGSELNSGTAAGATSTVKGSRARLNRRPAQPSLQMEPAFGEVGGLSLDLLDMMTPDQPGPPHLRRCAPVASGHARGLDTIFALGQLVISLTPKFYGRAGEVVGLAPKSAAVVVQFYPLPETWIDTSHLRTNLKPTAVKSNCDLDTGALAYQLGVPGTLVARLTGTLFVQCLPNKDTSSVETPATAAVVAGTRPKEYNVGLNLRNRDKSQFLGWSRFCAIRNIWLFSDATKNLLFDYMHRYPDLWCQLSNRLQHRNSVGRGPIALDLTQDQLQSVEAYLASSCHSTAESISNQGDYLYAPDLEHLRTLVSTAQCTGGGCTNTPLSQPLDREKWRNEPSVLCTPESLLLFVGRTVVYPTNYFTHLTADPAGSSKDTEPNLAFFTSFHLWTRVVYCRQNSALRFGLAGTVIGLPNGEASQLIEVMFDCEFPGAIDIRGVGPRCARLQRSSLICLPKSHIMGQYFQGNKSEAGQTSEASGGPIPGSSLHHQRNNKTNVTAGSNTNNNRPQPTFSVGKLQPLPQLSKAWPRATARQETDSGATVKAAGARQSVFTSPQRQKMGTGIHELCDEKMEIRALNALLSSCQLNEHSVAGGDVCLQAPAEFEASGPEPCQLPVSPNETRDDGDSNVDTVLSPLPPSSWLTGGGQMDPGSSSVGQSKTADDEARRRPVSSKAAVGGRRGSRQKTSSQRSPVNRPARPRTLPEAFSRQSPAPAPLHYPTMSNAGGGWLNPHQGRNPYLVYPSQPTTMTPGQAAGWSSAQPPFRSALAYGSLSGYPLPVPYYGGGMMNLRQFSYPGPPPFPQALSRSGPAPVWLPPFQLVAPPTMPGPPVANIRQPRGFIPPQVARKRCP